MFTEIDYDINDETLKLANVLIGGDLMFLKDTKTGATFLADSGSVPNLMKIETAQRYYPDEWSEWKPLRGNLTGVGGESPVDFLIIVSRNNEQVPFAVGRKYLST